MPHRRQVVCVFECRFPNDEVPFVCEGARGVRRLCVELWRARSGGALAREVLWRLGRPLVRHFSRARRLFEGVCKQLYFELAIAKACTVRNAAWRVVSVHQ